MILIEILKFPITDTKKHWKDLSVKVVIISKTVLVFYCVVHSDAALQYRTFVFCTNRAACTHDSSRMLTLDKETNLRT